LYIALLQALGWAKPGSNEVTANASVYPKYGTGRTKLGKNQEFIFRPPFKSLQNVDPSMISVIAWNMSRAYNMTVS